MNTIEMKIVEGILTIRIDLSKESELQQSESSRIAAATQLKELMGIIVYLAMR
jgi:hypothetical protein